MKSLILGKVLIFQIYLYDQEEKLCGWRSWATQVADFVVKLPELFNPQQKESHVSWIGMEIPCIFCTTGWLLRTCLSLGTSHSKLFRINSQTLASGWATLSSGTSRISTKFLFSIQLSNQKEIVFPLCLFPR